MYTYLVFVKFLRMIVCTIKMQLMNVIWVFNHLALSRTISKISHMMINLQHIKSVFIMTASLTKLHCPSI